MGKIVRIVVGILLFMNIHAQDKKSVFTVDGGLKIVKTTFGMYTSDGQYYSTGNALYSMFSPSLGVDLSHKYYINMGVFSKYQYVGGTKRDDVTGENEIEESKYHDFRLIPYVCSPIFLSSELSIGVGLNVSAVSFNTSDIPVTIDDGVHTSAELKVMLASHKGKKGYVYEISTRAILGSDETDLEELYFSIGRMFNRYNWGLVVNTGFTDFGYENISLSNGWFGVDYKYQLF